MTATPKATTFKNALLEGTLTPADLEDFVAEWHKGLDSRSLQDALGFTNTEYKTYLNTPDKLTLCRRIKPLEFERILAEATQISIANKTFLLDHKEPQLSQLEPSDIVVAAHKPSEHVEHYEEVAFTLEDFTNNAYHPNTGTFLLAGHPVQFQKVIPVLPTAPSRTTENYEHNLVTNHYACPVCKTEWNDTWSCACDDDCPNCGKRHISPTESTPNTENPAP
jgi:hypothetical protein